MWLQAGPHDLKISTAVYSFRGAELGRCFRVYVQPQECGVTITNSSNLAAAVAAPLAGWGWGKGR